ncbi:hypothetical protein EGW08_006723 [Elysia chlorotica]|uniref:EF-hand domain-containing protein n=1 Tax=Elysia chlorotica TaxID=188477 RepID=A0A3S0ZTK8_ELYCH|nr:hypothetical protein EGW08_006723 [Elysia chlorotica]
MLAPCIILLLVLQAQANPNYFQQRFAQTDRNRDNKISLKEYMDSLQFYDRNNDGRTTLSEWVSQMTRKANIPIDVSSLIFYVLDSDGNYLLNYVDKREVFKVMDFNDDGFVSREEFNTYWEQMKISVYRQLHRTRRSPDQDEVQN